MVHVSHTSVAVQEQRGMLSLRVAICRGAYYHRPASSSWRGFTAAPPLHAPS